MAEKNGETIATHDKDGKLTGSQPTVGKTAPTRSPMVLALIAERSKPTKVQIDYDALHALVKLDAKVVQTKTKGLTGAGYCQKMYDEACAAGKLAGDNISVVPMIVGSPPRDNPLGNEIDYTQETYFVEGGVCGFAWVHITPARGPFVNWCKEKALGTLAYRGGYDLNEDGDYDQSMQRKEAFCSAFAEVLRTHGINASMQSRMD